MPVTLSRVVRRPVAAPREVASLMNFRVELDTFRGPLDLLLYLVRKHEVEIVDLPVARVTDQFLDYLALLEQLDVNAVGDFLELASTLVEIKSRMVLPHGGEEVEDFDDPKEDLVRRLLEYKRYKDAAGMLEDRQRSWHERFARASNDLPPRERNLAEEPIHELELWDLVSAFGRIVRDSQTARPSNIVYDDTPIHVHMQRIHNQLNSAGRVALAGLFQAGMHKSSLVGIFLAILELVRHHGVRAEQDQLFGEIWIVSSATGESPVEFGAVDDYEHRSGELVAADSGTGESGAPSKPR